MNDPNEYSLICRRATIEGESMFEARVLELPDVVGYGDTREEAEEAALEAIAGLQELAAKRARAFPSPAHIPDETGRVTQRLPRDVHFRAIAYAALSDVSLNTLILTALVDYLARHESHGQVQVDPPSITYADATSGETGSLRPYSFDASAVRLQEAAPQIPSGMWSAHLAKNAEDATRNAIAYVGSGTNVVSFPSLDIQHLKRLRA